MALRVWLPLSGNYSNYGLSDIGTAGIGDITYAAGLFGDKCFDSGDSAVRVLLDAFPEEFTLSMWVKPASPSIGSTLIEIGANGDHIDISGDTTTYKWNGGNIVADNSTIFSINDGAWSFIVITADGSNIKAYVNGTLVTTLAESSFAASDIYIGQKSNGTGSWSGFIQDFRLYDHVISTREIIDLSAGLVLNYTFNHNGFGNENIMVGSTNDLIVTGRDKVNYVENNNFYADLTAGSYTLTAETTGTWAESNNSNGVLVDAGETDTYLTALELYTLDGNQEVDSRLFINMTGGYANITISNAGRYYLGGIIYSDGINEVTATFSYIKLETGATPTAWIPPKGTPEYGFYEIGEVEQDASGNGFDGSFGDLAPIWTNDSALYSGAYDFSNHAYIKSPAIDTTNLTQFTVSVWAKANSISGILFGFGTAPRFNFSAVGGVFGIYDSDTSQQIPFGSGTSVSGYVGEWHNYTITGDGTNNKLYIDGELIGETDKYVSLGRGYLFVNGWDESTANNFDGLMSDLRIYARAMSATQIASLCHTKAAIDNLGRVYSKEFVAGVNTFDISRKGVIKAKEFTVFNTPINSESVETDDSSRFSISAAKVAGVDMIEI